MGPCLGKAAQDVPPLQEGVDNKPQPTSTTPIAARRDKSSPGPHVPVCWHQCHRPRGCPSMLPLWWAHHGDTLSPKQRGTGSLPGTAPHSAPQQHQAKPIKNPKAWGGSGVKPRLSGSRLGEASEHHFQLPRGTSAPSVTAGL